MKSIVSLVATILLSTPLLAQDQKPTIVGYIENISITELDLAMKAKLDSGATTSSINALILEQPLPAQNTEDQYIVFSIKTEHGSSPKIRKKISRWVKIKKKLGGHILRPTVMMEFQIAGKTIKEEVNLANRDPFTYDVLIGRNMLTKGKFLIDSSQTFTVKPPLLTLNDKN
ncbi:MAG: ATP-dependent zinc protease family protein [Roseibacillus sp.]